ncbi:hypothetical protein Tco_1148804 [Tanacetum coccineum]
MSNTNNNLQTQTSSALHNAIMEAGGKDRPPMLAPVKWTKKTVLVIEGSLQKKLLQKGIYLLSTLQNGKGKAIVNSPPPTYDQEPEMVVEDDALSKEKEIDKLKDLISLSLKKIYKPTNNNLRTSSNTSKANQDNTLRINKGTEYDNQRTVNVVGAKENVARECQKPRRAKDAAYHKEKMLLYKQEEAGFQLNTEQAD